MDKRVIHTKKKIKDTFITLLNEKELNKITVSEICKSANINRATFYRYYLDIYDLLDKIKDEFVKELISIAKDNKNDTVKSFTTSTLEIFKNNKELTKILFKNKQAACFLNDILQIAYDKLRKQWKKDFPNINEEDMEYATIYMFNGALGIINYWIQNEFDKDIIELSSTIEKLMFNGINKYIQEKNV